MASAVKQPLKPDIAILLLNGISFKTLNNACLNSDMWLYNRVGVVLKVSTFKGITVRGEFFVEKTPH